MAFRWIAEEGGVAEMSEIAVDGIEGSGTVDARPWALSEEDIWRRMFHPDMRKRLIVTPPIDIRARIQKNTVTLSLGTKYIVFKGTKYAAVNPPKIRKDEVEDMLEKVELEYDGEIVIRPGQMVLAGTFEYISLPNDMSAQVGSRSTYGRMALIPATATFVHPGFKGCLTLELVNVGADPITVCPRMEVAQLMLQYSSPDRKPLKSKYNYSVGPEFPKVWDDTNLCKLKRFRARAW